MSNLAFPAGPSRTSSSATSTKTTGNSLGPTRSWRSKWYASLVLCGALVATVAWIAAALYLWHRDLYLPLNYFDNIQGTRGWLSNGGYNTLIGAVSGLVGAGIGYGISLGIQSIIRHKMLQSNGLSLYHYQALVKLSGHSLQAHVRRSAVVALVLFGLINQFNAASQAAFGTSASRVSFPVNFPFARISDNPQGADVIASMSSGSYLPHDGDYDDNVANALNNQLSSDNTSTPSVYGYSLIGGRGRPVYSIHHPTALLLGVDPRGVLTSAQTTLMAGSSNNLVETVVEGFIPTVTCTPLSTLKVFSSSASDPAKVAYSFTFPCGNKTAAYTLANPIVVDVHACMNGDPLIYVFALAPKQDQVLQGYECSVSVDSVMVPFLASASSRASTVAGTPYSQVTLPSGPEGMPVVTYLGFDRLNSFGANGFRALTATWILGEAQNVSTVTYIEDAISVLAGTALAHVSTLMTEYVVSNNGVYNATGSPLVMSNTIGQLRVQVLKLHLQTAQLGWIVLPALLALLLLYLTGFYLFRNSGQVDFTDPVAMALIGLSSDRDVRVAGAGTGDLKDESSHLKSLKFRYGKTEFRNGDPERLVLVTREGAGMLGMPSKGERYV